MNLTAHQLIGQRESREGTTTFRAQNPKTGDAINVAFADATESEIDAACALARSASEKFAALPREERARFLERAADALMDLGEPLLLMTEEETALPQPRLQFERGRTVGQLRIFAEVVRDGSHLGMRIDTAQPDRKPAPKPDIRRMLVPLGPVAIFGASNFPLAFSVAGGDTASALAAGCPVVIKGHPAHPGTSEMVGRALIHAAHECGLPDGTVSLIQGARTAVGRLLVRQEEIEAVGFTGSIPGGRALFDAAASRPRPIPVFAEMGSTNPVVVLPSVVTAADPAFIAGLASAITIGVGQFCTNPGILLALDSPDLDAFGKALGNALSEQPDGVMLHDGIARSYASSVAERETMPGVQRIGGSFAGAPTDGCAVGSLLLKTDAAALLEHGTLCEEHFGPSSMLITCKDEEQMVRCIHALGGQLTASIHGSDAELATHQQVIATARRMAGRVLFSGVSTGVEVCPSMHHGGPYPASTDLRSTSVGTAAVDRFLRPLCFQSAPESQLPKELQDATSGLLRLVNGAWSLEAIQ